MECFCNQFIPKRIQNIDDFYFCFSFKSAIDWRSMSVWNKLQYTKANGHWKMVNYALFCFCPALSRLVWSTLKWREICSLLWVFMAKRPCPIRGATSHDSQIKKGVFAAASLRASSSKSKRVSWFPINQNMFIKMLSRIEVARFLINAVTTFSKHMKKHMNKYLNREQCPKEMVMRSHSGKLLDSWIKLGFIIPRWNARGCSLLC